MSKLTEAVKLAYMKGYRVTPDGVVLGPRGRRKLRTTDRGHMEFSVRVGSTVLPIYVHRLVALQKFGEAALEDGVEVRHKNNNPSDNRPCNILLGSRVDNIMDQPRSVRVRRAKHAAMSLRKLTEGQAEQLREDRKAGSSYAALSSKYGVCKSTVSAIVNGRFYQTPNAS